MEEKNNENIIPIESKYTNARKLDNIDKGKIILTQPGKSIMTIGDRDGHLTRIVVSAKFNWLQKRLWKHLLNIDIEDIKENK